MDDTKFDRVSLKRASSNGAAVTLGSQTAKFALQLAYQILLARMLAPTDFGLVAMVAPIMAAVQLFADLGLSQATVQRAQITAGQVSLLFWVNVAAGAVLALVTIASAPLVGKFYGENRVVAITAVSGAFLFLSGLSSQHLALLNRDMAFGKLAVIELGSFVLGSVAGLAAAAASLGYWSILVAQGVISLANVVLAWSLSHWRPGKPAGGGRWRSLIGFGGNLTGFNAANFFARNLDNVLIGRFIGGNALGLYDRAYKLMLLPITQISQPLVRVALPLLARTSDQPSVYRKAYVRTLEVILLLTYPVATFAIVVHEQIIRVVLGEKWAGVAPIFAILGVGALFAPIGNSTGWLFMSQDRTREMRNWGVLSSALFVASFIAGLPWGPIGVACCYIGVGIVLQAPMVVWAATRVGPVSLQDLLGALMPHALSVAVCCAAELELQQALPIGLPSLAVLLVLAYAIYLATMLIQPRGRVIFVELWQYGKPALARLGLVH